MAPPRCPPPRTELLRHAPRHVPCATDIPLDQLKRFRAASRQSATARSTGLGNTGAVGERGAHAAAVARSSTPRLRLRREHDEPDHRSKSRHLRVPTFLITPRPAGRPAAGNAWSCWSPSERSTGKEGAARRKKTKEERGKCRDRAQTDRQGQGMAAGGIMHPQPRVHVRGFPISPTPNPFQMPRWSMERGIPPALPRCFCFFLRKRP